MKTWIKVKVVKSERRPGLRYTEYDDRTLPIDIVNFIKAHYQRNPPVPEAEYNQLFLDLKNKDVNIIDHSGKNIYKVRRLNECSKKIGENILTQISK